MKKWMIYLSLMLVFPSLVAASSLDAGKTDHSRPEKVSLSVSCSGNWVLQVFNAKTPVPDLVDISSGKGDSSYSYNTASDSSDGKYLASLSCDDQTSDGVNFCVDSPGCLKQVQDQKADGDKTGTQDQDQASGASGGGGGFYCTPQWSCSQWSFCSKDLQQTRDCVDLNDCELPRQEWMECSQCQESWVCSEWSECSNGINRRDCLDEHGCGTSSLMPDLQKSCQQAVPSGYQPSRISVSMPPPYIAPSQAAPSALQKFWQDYKLLLILGLLVLVILVTIILLLVHFLKPKHMAYNMDELKEWVRKEKAMGTSNEDIRAILKQHTGWKDEEIDAAFESLRPEHKPLQKPLKLEKQQLKQQPEKPRPAAVSGKPQSMLPQLEKQQSEESSLPEYAAAREEPTVRVENVEVFKVAAPSAAVSSWKSTQKEPAVRKRLKFSEERTLFKTRKPAKVFVPATTMPPKRERRKKKKTPKKAVKHEVKRIAVPKKKETVKKS